MPEPLHQVVDIDHSTLNTEHTSFYGLSIHLAVDGFSFCVFDPREQKYLALQSFKFQRIIEPEALCKLMEPTIKTHPWLSRTFQHTLVIVETPYNTLIPKAIYQPATIKDYMNFMNPVPDNYAVLADQLPNLDAVNLFGLSETLYQYISNKFKISGIHHLSSALIEGILLNFKNRLEEPRVFAHIRKEYFDLVITHENKLLFFNTFHYKSKEDFAYYVLYALEQFGLNPETTELVFLGEILRESGLYEISERYFRFISFIRNINWVNYTPEFEGVALHFYYPLLNLQLCEL